MGTSQSSLKLRFQIDLERCRNCGGELKIIAAILEVGPGTNDYEDQVTVTLQRRDGSVVHVRKVTRPKPQHQTLGSILKLDPNPGRTHRVLV